MWTEIVSPTDTQKNNSLWHHITFSDIIDIYLFVYLFILKYIMSNIMI